jgi:hypothetical protein
VVGLTSRPVSPLLCWRKRSRASGSLCRRHRSRRHAGAGRAAYARASALARDAADGRMNRVAHSQQRREASARLALTGDHDFVGQFARQLHLRIGRCWRRWPWKRLTIPSATKDRACCGSGPCSHCSRLRLPVSIVRPGDVRRYVPHGRARRCVEFDTRIRPQDFSHIDFRVRLSPMRILMLLGLESCAGEARRCAWAARAAFAQRGHSRCNLRPSPRRMLSRLSPAPGSRSFLCWRPICGRASLPQARSRARERRARGQA